MHLNTNAKQLFLTAQEAAELLNVSLSTLKKFIRTGKLATVTTPGGHHRILRSDLLRLGGSNPADNDPIAHEREKEELLFELTENFMFIIETRQRYCKGHSMLVSRTGSAISAVMGLSVEEQRDTRLAAFLHDVGKCNVSKKILNKPGKLTTGEYGRVKKHCQVGFDLLKPIKPFSRVAEIVRQHHERFDGTGYPFGRKGRQISIEARIVTVADSFDAMTSLTSYHKPLSLEQAFQELKSNSGKQFDPEVVDAFFKARNLTPRP